MHAMHDLDDDGLGAVLKTALDGVVVMRMDGTVCGWNDVAQRTFGWSLADARGRRMSDMIVPQRHREAHERGLVRYLATGEGPVMDRHFEINAVCSDGREIPVELSITRTEQFGEPVFLGFLRDISERHEAARRQDLMIGELNHRVKNLLAVVAGIAHQTARSSLTVPDFSRAFEGRLVSLGRAHEILNGAAWDHAPLRSLLDELLGPYLLGEAPQVVIGGPHVLLPPRHLLSLSMIVHELLTNAVKYGGLSSPSSRIAVMWSVDGGDVSFVWSEGGLVGVKEPTRRGFGTRMMALSVDHELRGSSRTEWREDGLCFSVSFPITSGAA